MLPVIWTLSPGCFITSYPQQHRGAVPGRQRRTHNTATAALGGPASVSLLLFWDSWGLGIIAVSQHRCPLGDSSVHTHSTFIHNLFKWTPSGSLWMTQKPLHYSAQYVSQGCLQIQGFSCQMYRLLPRLSCYNEMKNKQDILISYSVRKWDFFPPPSLLIDKLISSNILKRSFMKTTLLPKKKKNFIIKLEKFVSTC